MIGSVRWSASVENIVTMPPGLVERVFQDRHAVDIFLLPQSRFAQPRQLGAGLDRAGRVVRVAERIDVDGGVRDAAHREQIGYLAHHRGLARSHRAGDDERFFWTAAVTF